MTNHQSDRTRLELPAFDVSKPLSPSSLSCLASACREWGFFQIMNHGISKDMYGKIYSLSNNIFKLSSEVKLRLGPLSLLRTYTPQFIASPYFESLRVSGPDFASSAQNSVDVLFSDDQVFNSVFSELMQEYGTKVSELSNTILKLLLRTLELEDEKLETEAEHFESEFKSCHGYFRINNYTAPNDQYRNPNKKEDQHHETEGLGMHTDMSCLTILYQDETGGLQVRSRQGKWLDIVPREGTLVVNIGDMLQAWSNDRLRSSEHRVVFDPTRSLANRFSLAFFWCFEDEKVIHSPDEIVGKNKRMYDAFVCKDYVKFRENNERGKFEKVGFTVKDFAGINDVLCESDSHVLAESEENGKLISVGEILL